MPCVAPLNDAAIHTLTDMPRLPPSRRARLRAPASLLSHQGFSLHRIAAISQVSRDAVSAWLERWHSAGLVGLDDRPRSGRPPHLTADAPHQVDQSLPEHPKDVQPVAHGLEQETTTRVRTTTSQRLIKKPRSVWKRLRTTPPTSPEPATSQRAHERLADLQARARAGACDLGDCDASGLCLAPCLPSAWQPIGHPWALPQSAHNQRLHVFGLL
jgi:transposase